MASVPRHRQALAGSNANGPKVQCGVGFGMAFPSQGRRRESSPKEGHSHYEVYGDTLQGGFCSSRMGGLPESVVVSQAEEDTPRLLCPVNNFYSNFTTLLRDLYDSASPPWYPLHGLSG